MLVKYIGPYESVEVAALAHRVVVKNLGTFDDLGEFIENGGVLDVDDALGVLLCEQTTNWEPGDAESLATFDAFCAWIDAHEKVIHPVTAVAVWVPKAPAEAAPPAVVAAGRRRPNASATADESIAGEAGTTTTEEGPAS